MALLSRRSRLLLACKKIVLEETAMTMPGPVLPSRRRCGILPLLSFLALHTAAPLAAQIAPGPPGAAARASGPLPSLANAEELAGAPYAWYVPAGARAPGAFGSQWRTDMFVRNGAPPGTPAADVILIAHPRGQVAGPSDPSYTFALPSGSTLPLVDVLSLVTPEPLSAWIEVRSTSPLTVNDPWVYNLASTGDRTGTSLPVFEAATLQNDQRLLGQWDRVEFILAGATGNARENTLTWVAPESCDAAVTHRLLDPSGNVKAGGTQDVKAGSYEQSSVEEAVGAAVGYGHVLETSVACAPGSAKPLLAWSVVAQISTVNPRFQDSVLLSGTKYPLANVTFSSPLDGEQNDAATFSARIDVPFGVAVACGFHEYGIPADFQFNLTNTAEENPWFLQYRSVLGAGGSSGTAPAFGCSILGRDGVLRGRTWTNPPFIVRAEKNGYVATKADAQAFVRNNLNEASWLASPGTLGGRLYLPSEWKTLWPRYFDGVSAADNPEVKSVTFDDVGNGTTTGGNEMVLELDDGQRHVVGGLPEAYLDRLRQKMKATLPP
ncbi:MAG: hypothetical protein KJ062_08135 [Thermoanaerobaculia bacterium]|nr:hypothetical protein [Thermoanaerobaculia bacterium]